MRGGEAADEFSVWEATRQRPILDFWVSAQSWISSAEERSIRDVSASYNVLYKSTIIVLHVCIYRIKLASPTQFHSPVAGFPYAEKSKHISWAPEYARKLLLVFSVRFPCRFHPWNNLVYRACWILTSTHVQYIPHIIYINKSNYYMIPLYMWYKWATDACIHGGNWSETPAGGIWWIFRLVVASRSH